MTHPEDHPEANEAVNDDRVLYMLPDSPPLGKCTYRLHVAVEGASQHLIDDMVARAIRELGAYLGEKDFRASIILDRETLGQVSVAYSTPEKAVSWPT